MPKSNHITSYNLNRPIIINKYVFTQDDSGGNVKTLSDSYTLMADVKPISNSYLLQQMQVKYGEGYTITVRFEPSRLLTPNDEIVYKNGIHKIQSIKNQEEAGRRFVIITTETINNAINVTN